MEGFVSANSVFEQELRRNSNYANYGVGRPDRKVEHKVNESRQNQVKLGSSATDVFSGQNTILSSSTDDLKDALSPEFVNSAINSFDTTVVDTITDDHDDNKHKIRKYFVVGASVALLGGLSLLFSKGKVSKGITNLTGKIIDKTNKKIEKIKGAKDLSKAEGLYLSSLQFLSKGLGRVRGTFFNFSPIKDVLFERIVREKLKLGKVCDGITGAFKKVSFGTVNSYYKKSDAAVKSMTDVFEETNKKIADGVYGPNVDSEKLEAASGKIDEIKKLYIEHFSLSKVAERSDNVFNSFKGLGGKIYDTVYGNFREFFRNIDSWTTFISEKFVADKKAVIIKDLDMKKSSITCSPADVHSKLSTLISDLEQSVDGKHETSREFLKKLKSLSKKYAEVSGEAETKSGQEILQAIREHIKSGEEIAGNSVYSSEKGNHLKDILKRIEEVLDSGKNGAIEDLLSYYKEVLPKDEYEVLLKSAQKARLSLNKAVHNEGSNYTDKLRDLSVGSALTDVAIGMGLPLLTTGIAVSAADTKEKKRSVILKYGVPLMVGVATSSACALRLISGGKALILGIITSTLTNNICERIDKKLLKKSAQEVNEA